MMAETTRDGGAMAELRANARVLLGCTIGACVSVSGLFFYTSSVFFVQLREALGWSPSALGLVHAVFTGSLALAVPFAGALLDRMGPRRPIAFSFAAVALCYTLLALLAASFPVYIVLHIVLGSLGSACSTVGFSSIVSASFDRARGLALGIVIAGLGVVAMVAPPLLTLVIGAYGWRGGYLSMAAVVVILGALSLWLIGPSAAVPASDRSAGKKAFDSSIFRSPFWLLLVAFAVGALFSTGFMVHLIAILKTRGVSTLAASGMAGMAGVGLLLGRVGSGWLMDRVFAPRVGSAIFLGFALGLGLIATGSRELLLPGVILIGMCLGAELDVLGYLVSRYFPIGNFGRVYSVIYGVIFVIGGCSPLLLAYLSRQGADYGMAFTISFFALVFAAVLLLFAPPFPARPSDASRPE